LGNENYDAGHIKSSRGLHLAHRLPTPGLGVQFRSGTSKQKWPKTYLTCDVTQTKNKTQNIFF